MDKDVKNAGGIFVVVLMLLTLNPFNNDIQALASAADATAAAQALGIVFPLLYVGLMFTILAFTGYSIIKDM